MGPAQWQPGKPLCKVHRCIPPQGPDPRGSRGGCSWRYLTLGTGTLGGQEYIVLVDEALACVMRAREQAVAWVVFYSGKYHGKALFLKFQKSEAAREQKSEKSEKSCFPLPKSVRPLPSLFPRRLLPHRTCSFSHHLHSVSEVILHTVCRVFVVVCLHTYIHS